MVNHTALAQMERDNKSIALHHDNNGTWNGQECAFKNLESNQTVKTEIL